MVFNFSFWEKFVNKKKGGYFLLAINRTKQVSTKQAMLKIHRTLSLCRPSSATNVQDKLVLLEPFVNQPTSAWQNNSSDWQELQVVKKKLPHLSHKMSSGLQLLLKWQPISVKVMKCRKHMEIIIITTLPLFDHNNSSTSTLRTHRQQQGIGIGLPGY
jgi:hypothetical protein